VKYQINEFFSKKGEALQWLNQELEKPHSGKTVVISHHAPILHLTNDCAYASDLASFIKKHADHIDIWMHGHIHHPEDNELAGVRIVSNPRGYPEFDVSKHFTETKLINSSKCKTMPGIRISPPRILCQIGAKLIQISKDVFIYLSVDRPEGFWPKDIARTNGILVLSTKDSPMALTSFNRIKGTKHELPFVSDIAFISK
jgi:hypothetical protein